MNKDMLIEFAKRRCELFPENSDMWEYLSKTLKMLQAEPCEDAISKASVFEIMGNLMSIPYDLDRPINKKDVSESMDEIKALPPAKPTQNWIPVSERLPKPFTFVNATCRSLVDDRENWVVETMYLPIPKEDNEQDYSDWGNIPMLNWGKAEVIAWMERKIPEPYKGSEEV